MHSYTVEPLYVNSGHEVIAADFYRPKTEHKPAVIIMAHGWLLYVNLNWCNMPSVLPKLVMP